jgi:Protein of unknown function (DUF732)
MMIKATVWAIVGTLSITLAPVAHADSADDQFLGLLASQGISGDPSVLIGAAHESCDARAAQDQMPAFDIGLVPPAPTTMSMEIGAELADQGLSMGQDETLMLDAYQVYCPQYTWYAPDA